MKATSRDLVMRSLITLKALTYRADRRHRRGTHDLAAGKARRRRNWDYRFCWLRDATFTLLALMNSRLHRGGLGLAQLAAARGRRLAGRHADHVRHHGPAAPAGMGGGLAARLRRRAAGPGRQRRACAIAARCLWRTDRRLSPIAHGRAEARRRTWALECAVLEHLAEVWDQPDHGIWERRGERQALRLVEGDDMGRVRSRHQERREVRLRGAARRVASAARCHPSRRLRKGF